MTLAPGAQLGPYTITAELGHGGMGVVYTAHDPRLKGQVAIKLLPLDLTREEQPTKLQSSWWKSSRVNCPCRTRSDATSRGRQPTGRCVV